MEEQASSSHNPVLGEFADLNSLALLDPWNHLPSTLFKLTCKGDSVAAGRYRPGSTTSYTWRWVRLFFQGSPVAVHWHQRAKQWHSVQALWLLATNKDDTGSDTAAFPAGAKHFTSRQPCVWPPLGIKGRLLPPPPLRCLWWSSLSNSTMVPPTRSTGTKKKKANYYEYFFSCRQQNNPTLLKIFGVLNLKFNFSHLNARILIIR